MNIVKKMKWFIVGILVVLLAGMTMFGIMGFNNTVDYSKSYEVQVSVDQTIDQAKETLKSSADKYFSDNKISSVSYAYQELDEGATLVYKFNEDISDKVAGLEGAVNNNLKANDKTKDVIAKVVVSEVNGVNNTDTLKTLLALGVGIVVIFVYALIMEKVSGAVSVLCSSILSLLVFISLLSITRLPAVPFVEIIGAVAVVFSALLSVSTVGRYREELKSAEKLSANEVAQKVAVQEGKKYILALISVFISAVALSALLSTYMMFAGLQILLAGISATTCAYCVTPLIWTGIKGRK